MTAVPHLNEIVRDMLAYDLIGFQTVEDRQNFEAYLHHELGITPVDGTIVSQWGWTQLATFPIGIDVDEFAKRANKAAARPEISRLRASLQGTKLVLGVDRLDYSKGLANRVRAFDRLLDIEPSFKREVALLQVAVPSRGNIRAYRELKAELAALVSEVNGRHGEVDWTPIRYLNKGFSQLTLAGFYRTAHVGLVTPLHDGMNLVAKEYVAAQNPFDPGVLVLSSFAGAAKELDAALLVNPHDIDGMARAIAAGLAMRVEERRERWQSMVVKLKRASVQNWFSDFLHTLSEVRRAPAIPANLPQVLDLAQRRAAQQADANHRRSVLRVLARTERMVPRPAFLAASCKAWRISSRFSWIEAITGPAATPNPTSAASESCKLASTVSGTASVAPSP